MSERYAFAYSCMACAKTHIMKAEIPPARCGAPTRHLHPKTGEPLRCASERFAEPVRYPLPSPETPPLTNW